MQIANNSVFNNNVGSYGNWVSLAQYADWSLHITGLESDGNVAVWLSNEPFKPTDRAADTNAVLVGGVVVTTSTGSAMVKGSDLGPAHWLQIQKTQGATPTDTVVWLFARLG